MHSALKLATVVCALAGAMQARAESVAFAGFAHGSESVNYSLSAPNAATSGSASAGGFLTSLNGGSSFEAYCVDLYQTIGFGAAPYTEYSAPGTTHTFANSNAYGDLGKLYVTAGLVGNSVQEAAFQIAAWEIAFETTGAYDLANGAATFTGGSAATSGALSLASSWLGSLGAIGTPISVLESGEHQDVIFAPVPEPTTTALMLMGLMGMGLAAARRGKSDHRANGVVAAAA